MNKNHKLIGLLVLSMSLLMSCGNEPEPKEIESQETESQNIEPKETKTMENETAAEAAKDVEVVANSTPEIDKSNPDWKQKLELPALYAFEAGKTYYWDMRTNKGEMSFKLYHESAPMHATSTIFLTELGFYDDVIFHRIIPGFMAQGGDPTGTGRSGPGYKYEGEFDGSTSHTLPGLLSMANAGPGTDGSQFFITFAPTLHLDGKHTIFGEIVKGEETLKQLEQFGNRSGKTSEKIVIEQATIRVE